MCLIKVEEEITCSGCFPDTVKLEYASLDWLIQSAKANSFHRDLIQSAKVNSFHRDRTGLES